MSKNNNAPYIALDDKKYLNIFKKNILNSIFTNVIQPDENQKKNIKEIKLEVQRFVFADKHLSDNDVWEATSRFLNSVNGWDVSEITKEAIGKNTRKLVKDALDIFNDLFHEHNTSITFIQFESNAHKSLNISNKKINDLRKEWQCQFEVNLAWQSEDRELERNGILTKAKLKEFEERIENYYDKLPELLLNAIGKPIPYLFKIAVKSKINEVISPSILKPRTVGPDIGEKLLTAFSVPEFLQYEKFTVEEIKTLSKKIAADIQGIYTEVQKQAKAAETKKEQVKENAGKPTDSLRTAPTNTDWASTVMASKSAPDGKVRNGGDK